MFPCLLLFLDFNTCLSPLWLVVTRRWGHHGGQYQSIRGTQELSHTHGQGEVCEEGHGLTVGYFFQELQEVLIQRAQAGQDTTENHPMGGNECRSN